MFGAYQAGAWKTLAPVFEPQMVVGSSVGALNGWMIAGGATPDDLIRQWNDPRMAAMMRLRVPWPPWRGIFAVRALESLARELAERWRPRIPFYATAAEMPGLRLRLMRGEEMTWRHLLAACAVPLGFPPVRIDGRLFVDGGLLSRAAHGRGGPTRRLAHRGRQCAARHALARHPRRRARGAVRGAGRLSGGRRRCSNSYHRARCTAGPLGGHRALGAGKRCAAGWSEAPPTPPAWFPPPPVFSFRIGLCRFIASTA